MSDPSDIVTAVVSAGRKVRSKGRLSVGGDTLIIPRGLASALAAAGFVNPVPDTSGTPATYTFMLTEGTDSGATAVIS